MVSSPPVAVPFTSAWKRRPRLFTSTMSPGAIVRSRTWRTLREGSAVHPEKVEQTHLAEDLLHALRRRPQGEPVAEIPAQSQQAPEARRVHEVDTRQVDDDRAVARRGVLDGPGHDRRGREVERADEPDRHGVSLVLDTEAQVAGGHAALGLGLGL